MLNENGIILLIKIHNGACLRFAKCNFNQKQKSLAHAHFSSFFFFEIEHCNKMRSDNGHMKWARALALAIGTRGESREPTGIGALEMIRE